MIYLFPDFETLRIALTSGQVPASVSREPVEVAFDSAGQVSVKSHGIPPKTMQNALKRLGIKVSEKHLGEPISLASWPQILPIVRMSGTPEFTSTTPVLFEMPLSRLSTLATEMLRLGNDRQSFHVLDADIDAEKRVLLRVIGPPYYTLLRALDHLNADVTAYLEQAPRVWIEMGCTHPLTSNIKVAEGQALLLRSPRSWQTIADSPFLDLYEVLDFQLPKASVAFVEGKLKGKLTVPLRLAAGNAAEVPEMWVLKENAVNVFDAFVRDADDRLMSRLIFAVAENGEREPAIVVRTRTSKLTPPPIELDGAIGYVPFRRLHNLFLPVGTRLAPTLRRDAVRKMLAEDDAQVIWLASAGDGRFVPESLPDAAFRPLPDWIEYVIDHQREPLQNWIQATRFDFDDFICKDDSSLDRPKPPGSGKPKQRKPGALLNKIDADEANELPEEKGHGKSRVREENDYAVPQLPAKPDELKIKRTELEQAFLEIDGSLDAPERVALWPQLAQVNAALGDHAEAAICWLNSFWEVDDVPAEGARAWLSVEGQFFETSPAGNLKKLLANPTPSQADLRQLAALLFFLGTDQRGIAILKAQHFAIVAYLDSHDGNLPIRASWLVRRNLAALCGDVLGLARVRDRLLEQLFTKGLRMPQDVPNFIRFAGRKETDRLRRVVELLHRFRTAVRTWLIEQDEAQAGAEPNVDQKKTRDSGDLLHKTLSPTTFYADLIFAYGFARIGEDSTRKEIMATALAKLRATKGGSPKTERIPFILADVFEFRIEQAALGNPAGPLPPGILGQMDSANPELMYGVNHLRDKLHVLEPIEKGDPYIVFKSFPDALNQKLAALRSISEPTKLVVEVRRILQETLKKASREHWMYALTEIVPLSVRVGEEFAKEMLDHVLPLFASGKRPTALATDAERLGKLIDAAIPIAANYGWSDLVQQILQRFVSALEPLDESMLIVAINHAVGRWRRALQKCGLAEQVRATLASLSARLDKDRPIEKIRREYESPAKRKNWVDMLRAQLLLAECWLTLGEHAKAQPIIDEARAYLLDDQGETSKNRPIATLYVPLVCSYVRTIGQNGDLDFVVLRLMELLGGMDVISNKTSTGAYYSWFHMAIVESVVLTLVSDDLILGDEARRYLDDDEYLVRRRIHGEMRKLLAQSGL